MSPALRSPRRGSALARVGACAVAGALACATAQVLAEAAASAADTGAPSGARGVDIAPLPGPPRPLAITAPTEMRLANGLRVVLAERRGVQLVTATLLVLTGSEADPPQRAGLASLTAGLLTKGTRHRDATRIAQDAESLGGSLDAGAGWHESQVGITVMLPKLDAALALVSEVAREPAFAPAELERLRLQTLDEMKVAYSRPETLARLAAQRVLYGEGMYAHPASGTPASLPRIRRDDLVALHAATFRPENAVLVLTGDLDPGTARRIADRHFGRWTAPPSTAPTGPSVPNAEAPQTTVLVDLPQSGQAAVVVAAPLPPLGPDRATAAVMNAVLGGGFSSRLNQEIRIRRGLSYGAGSRLDARREGGALAASAQTKNESAAEVVQLLQEEFDRLATTPVPDAELAARKATLIGEFSRGVETTAGLNGVVGGLVVAGLPTAELSERIARLSAVTAADVQRYAAARLGAATRRVVVVGEADRFAETLRARTPGGGASVLTLSPEALGRDAVDVQGVRR